MRILSISYTPNLIKNSPNQRGNLVNYSTGKDTFTSFKANPKPALAAIQKGAQEVLSNPDLMRKEFPAFLAAAFAAMAGLAKGVLPSEKDAGKAAEDFAIIVANEHQYDTEEEIQEEALEIEGLRSAEIKEDSANKQPAKGIELPRRHGTLSAQEAHLRETALKIDNISKESEQKIRDIWNVIISRGYSSDEERKSADKSELALRKQQSNMIAVNMATKLEDNLSNSERLEEIIDNYHEEIQAVYDNTNIDKTSSSVTEADKSAEEITEENTESEITFTNEKKSTLEYVHPGTLSDSFTTNLNNFWNSFKYKVSHEAFPDQKINWKESYPIRFTVNQYDILEEIRSKRGRDRYRNIKTSMASEIADVINNEPRFKKYFKLHSAMRLIDRFVDFNNEIDTQTQVTNIINKLESLIESEFKKKCKAEIYEDGNGDISASLIIDLSKADDKYKKIFGTTTLNIGICKIKEKNYFQDDSSMINTIVVKGACRG